MKATGIVRRIDDLGRVVIPKEIRRTMRIREGDPLQTTLVSWEKFCFGMLDLAGIRIGTVGKAYACEKLHSLGFRVLLAFSEKLHRRKGHISEQCHMRKEVEVLENHTHLLTVEIYIAARISYINAVKGYRAAGGHLKEIEASEEG